MDNYNLQVYEEHAKDLYREAELERLARSARNQSQGVLKNARNALGRGLVAARQNLLK